jgi:hypothetical protein
VGELGLSGKKKSMIEKNIEKEIKNTIIAIVFTLNAPN